MPEEVEVETKDLQETIEELQEERKEREQAERQNAWTRYIALTTAILAVFAAIAALQSGSLINESMMDQLRASDKWNEYQAARQKEHLYTVQAEALLDRGATPSSSRAPGPRSPAGTLEREPKGASPRVPAATEAARGKAAGSVMEWTRRSPAARLREYLGQVQKEADKENDLQQEARDLERESDHKAHVHHEFADSVALIQVAISLSAVAALTRMKSVWWLSLAVGLAGIAFFVIGTTGLR